MPTATPLSLHDADSFGRPFAHPAMSVERSTIKSEPSDKKLLRLGTDTYKHVSPLPSLFSPPTTYRHFHQEPETEDHRRSHSPMSSSDYNEQQPLSPNQPQGNRMSVQQLCSPHSSLPPHIALARDRASTSYVNDARLTHSPSSATSNLSPHSYTSSLPPPSPSIAVLDPISRSHITHHSHRSISPVSAFPMTPPTAHNTTYTYGAVSSPHADSSPSPTHAMATMPVAVERKRKRNDSVQVTGSVGMPTDEIDERTKTWKHATGFRRDLTSDKLTQPDAPTRKKRQNTIVPSPIQTSAASGQRVTSTSAMTPSTSGSAAGTSASHTTTSAPSAGKTYSAGRRASFASQHSGSGDSIALDEEHSGTGSGNVGLDDEDDELLEAAGELGVSLGPSASPASRASGADRKRATSTKRVKVDANVDEIVASPSPDAASAALAGSTTDADELARLEKKRRQNTQAARRSRIRKAEEVQRLQNSLFSREARIADLERQLADVQRDADKAEAQHQRQVQMVGLLRNSIVDLVGEDQGGEVIAAASARWKAIYGKEAQRAQKVEDNDAGADDRMAVDRAGSGS